MSIITVSDWGRDNEGIHTMRVNATKKEDLLLIIEQTKKAGFKFWNTPAIEKTHKSWSVLIQLMNPNE